MLRFDAREVVDMLINEYGLTENDCKKTVFSKMYEYFYDYFRNKEEDVCVIAMDNANNVSSDTENLNEIYSELKRRIK